jgi:wyosine [tRNA(Phe)-imidazoG37] synthetase (radical SAM superfamily)
MKEDPYQASKALYHLDRLEELRRSGFISPTLIQVDPIAYCNDNCRFCAYREETMYNTPMLKLIDAKPSDVTDHLGGVGKPTEEGTWPEWLADSLAQQMVDANIPAIELSIRGDELVPVRDDKDLIRLVTIEELVQKKELRKSFTLGQSDNFEEGLITDYVKHPQYEPLIKITLQTGRHITVTKSHSIFFYENGKIIYKAVSEAKCGDLVVLNNAKPHIKIQDSYHGIKLDTKLCRLFGWFVAEGSFGYQRQHVPHHIQFTLGKNEKEKERVKDICSILNYFGWKYHIYEYSNKTSVQIQNRSITELFLSIGFGNYANQKQIPDIIFNTSHENQMAFLQGLFAGDSNFRNTSSRIKLKRNVIQLKTSSLRLQRTLFYLLDLMDIRATCGDGINKIRKIENRVLPQGAYYTISINSRQDIEKLLPVVAYIGGVCKYASTKFSHHKYHSKLHTINTDCYALPIKKIETLETIDEFVYDISVNNTHRFESSFRILCHNTGGGEPTLWRGFDKLVNSCLGYKREVGVVTNGSQLNDERAKMLAHCTWVRFSMDASSSETHQKIHRTPNQDFDRRIENIRRLVAYKLSQKTDCTIGISFLLQQENLHEIESAVKLYKKTGVDNLRITLMYDKTAKAGLTDVEMTNVMNTLNILKQVEETSTFKLLFDSSRLSNFSKPNTDFNKCYLQHFVWAIGGDCKVYPCCIMKYHPDYAFADIREQTLLSIVRDTNFQAKQQGLDVTKCFPCWLRTRNQAIAQSLEKPKHHNFL